MQTSPSENKSSSNNNNNVNAPVTSNNNNPGPVFPSEQQQQQIDSCYNNNNNNLGTMKNQNLMDANQTNWAYTASPLHVSQEYADEHLPPQLKSAVHSPQMGMKSKVKRGSSSPVGYTINGILGLQQDFEGEKRKRSDGELNVNSFTVNYLLTNPFPFQTQSVQTRRGEGNRHHDL